MRWLTTALAACWAVTAHAAEPVVVWWEGEDAVEHNFPQRTGFSPQTFADTRELLSGGDWLSSDGKVEAAPRYARYRVTVPGDGEYALWSRKFWKHGPFRWRFGDGQWQTCGRDVSLLDSVTLRTHLGTNWVYLGQTTLAAGEATFELELLADEGKDATAAFDCFALAQGPFIPRGKLKPGDRLTAADDGFFAFDAGLDRFGDDALLDLRRLNEAVAGQSGPLRRDGDKLTLGDGTPVRLWAVNLGPDVFELPPVALDYLARRLAKLGVNMVRLHGAVFLERDPAQINVRRIEGMQRTVAAFKSHGIYTTLSFYFPLWMRVTPASGLEGFEGFENRNPFGLIFFNPRMQALHRQWTTALLTTPNPHTGVPLGQDPAVGMVELVNEDSLFFWTFSKKNIPPAQWAMLEEQFGQWLSKRDGKPRGRTEIFEAWHMTRQGRDQATAARRKHIADQVRFLAELQRGFYESATRHVRDELHFRGLIVAGNWSTADPALLDALERYSYTPGDVIDHHGYVDRGHEGDGAAWSVRTGHLFADTTTMAAPSQTPMRIDQLAGWPSIISEVNWTNPTPYRAETTALLAAYGSLQGLDGIYLFAVTDAIMLNQSLGKFDIGNAAIGGTFPAAALLFRRGDVREAPAVIHQTLRLDDLYALKGQTTGGGSAALDAFRAANVPPGAVAEGDVTQFDAQAFFVGRVTRSIVPAAVGQRSRQLNTAELIRRDDKRITSVTGELAWDWGRRYMTVNAPRCVAAVGFLKEQGPIALGDVTIRSDNDYGSVFVVALDDEPVARSRRLLVQAMTREQYRGFATEAAKNDKGEDRRRITSLGAPPLNVQKIVATVTLPGEGWRATPLDGNGYAASEAEAVDGSLQLPNEALYTILTRE